MKKIGATGRLNHHLSEESHVLFAPGDRCKLTEIEECEALGTLYILTVWVPDCGPVEMATGSLDIVDFDEKGD